MIVRGCEFRADGPQVKLGEQVRRGVITDNLMRGTLRIDNRSQGQVVIEGNADDAPTDP